MTRRELAGLEETICFIKREWLRFYNKRANAGSVRERLGWGYAGGACQAYHDSLLAICQYFRLDIEISMRPLPKDFDIRKHIKS